MLMPLSFSRPGALVPLGAALVGSVLGAQQPLRFAPPAVYDLGNEAPSPPAAADFDEDGHLDLVVGCAGSSEQFQGGQLGILRGTGAGGFEDLYEVSFGPRFARPVVADFDLDGHQDIAVVRHYPVLPREIVVFFGDGAGGFAAEVPLAASTPGYLLASADLDHDGSADLVNDDSTGGLSVLRGNGDGTFGAPIRYGLGEVLDLEVCDMNLDGNADIAVGHRFGAVQILLGDGLGHLVGAGAASPPGPSFMQQWNSVGVGDVDGGGPDVLWGTSFPFATWAASGGGDGSLSAAMSLLPSLSAFDLAVADFDGDGAGDVAVIYGASSQVLRGHGDGSFDMGVVLPAPTRGNGLLVLDANGDGRPDIVTVDRNSGDNGLCSVYLNGTGDTIPPVLTCPAGLSVRAPKGAPRGAFVAYTVTATDLVDPAPSIVCAPPSGNFFPWGTTVVLCTATDASGNHSTRTFEVVVQPTVRRR